METRPLDAYAERAARVLVISPHPDDELIGCGGTLIRMRSEGAAVTILQLTDGSATAALEDQPSAVRRVRRLEEARLVASKLGAEMIAWNEPDGRLAVSTENVARLAALLHAARPSIVFVPFPGDPHPDHAAANRMLAAALRRSKTPLAEVRIAGYEVWALLPANALSSIDRTVADKLRLLLDYRTGMKVVDYVRFCRQLAAYRALATERREGFTEAFWVLDGPSYLQQLER
jgi:LmbE family N-acetylglucosaminyl deacetylase